jgi:plastocyanin
MDTATVFYVVGAVLAVTAVAVSFLGLKLLSFPGRAAPVVIVLFALLIGGATTFAVRNGQEEEEVRAAELEKAGEEVEAAEGEAGSETETGSPEAGAGETVGEEVGQSGTEGAEPPGGATGKAGTAAAEALKLAADSAEIAFDTTSLDAKAGKVTIDFDNPAPLEHNVAIEEGGSVLAESETIAEGKTSVSAELKPGTYTFLCTVPGHAEAGMEGTLTVR